MGRVRSIVSVAAAVMLWGAAAARGEHPQVLTTPTEREALKAKIETAPWAKAAYAKSKAEVDRYMELCKKDPKYLSSRLCMYWNTHYTTTLVSNKEKWVGGEGHAPVPTPHFAGERDWAGKYTAPKIEEMKPYANEDNKVWMIHKETGKAEWANPAETGHSIEQVNRIIMDVADDAAFIYFLTGDEKYAAFATEIFWTYMEGFSYTTAPKFVEANDGPVIGVTSFEVIHESIVVKLALAYDFLQPFLAKNNKDIKMVQSQFQRMADRVIDGGGNSGNWNLHQARIISYAGLSLEPNSAYSNKKGREYYIDVVLNAKLPRQTGIVEVLNTTYEKETAMWPEAAGYAFGTTASIVEVAAPLSTDPKSEAAKAILSNPILSRAALAQTQLVLPNGYSIGVGDTHNNPISTVTLEFLIAVARQHGDSTLEGKLTSALRAEIDAGRYDRAKIAGGNYFLALTKFVSELKPVAHPHVDLPRMVVATPTNVVMQRSLAESLDYSLMGSIYGTGGGHNHSNGMAIELFGGGLPMGGDPGSGSSYWQADYRQYYHEPPAHNTVIVNAKSNYGTVRWEGHPMTLDFVDPASGAAPTSPAISVAQGTFTYQKPPAQQQRTLALVRISPTSGFFVDVFRSSAKEDPAAFHDYLYHNLGQSLDISDGAGKALPLKTSALLNTKDALKGYSYFKNEKSADCSGTFHAMFTATNTDKVARQMSVWMLGGSGKENRRVFAVEAPQNNSVRDTPNRLFMTMPMPTIVVRQNGDAWKLPFVAVYEPFLSKDGALVKSIRSAQSDDDTVAAVTVDGGAAFTALIVQDDMPQKAHRVESTTVQGSFAAVIQRGGKLSELYLANGMSLRSGEVAMEAEKPVSASVRRSIGGWRYSSTGPIRVTLSPAPSVMLPAGEDLPVAGK